jgi:hypothetical protein
VELLSKLVDYFYFYFSVPHLPLQQDIISNTILGTQGTPRRIELKTSSMNASITCILFLSAVCSLLSLCATNGFHRSESFYIYIFDKSVEFISKSSNLKGAPPNYTKSITKST